MNQRIPIRAKLAFALLIPVLAVFAVSIFEVRQANENLSRVRQDTDLAQAALGPEGLITSLQDERNDSAITVLGLRDTASLETESIDETRETVDVASREFREALARSGPEAEAVYAEALDAFDEQTAALRQRFDAAMAGTDPSLGQLPLSNEMWIGYTESIDGIIDANTRLTLQIEDPELRSAAEMLDAVSRQTEGLGVMIRTGAISSLGGDDVDGTRVSDVIASLNQFESNEERIDVLATGSYAETAGALDQNPSYEAATDQLEAYVQTGELDTTSLIEAVTVRVEPNTESVAADAAAALEARSDVLRSDAEGLQRNFVLLAALVFVLGGAFMVLVARTITRPLLSLTRQADEMASNTLPAAVQDILDQPLGEDVIIPEISPIEVKTRDEVREVATALTSVQRSAVDLAVEQAVLRRNFADSFVNLGRRTQNLIGRQLDFITELERNETDPEALDNLFKLDHLATRARRNAESLVVLAGLVTPRTWTAPIPMADVIRAALGEIEDYQRVETRVVADATVPGRVAADLVHLLAELLENGLSFSPPGRPVEIFGRMTRNGYVLAVVDQGIGMTKSELDLANERLAGRERYTVAPSKYLGHYVAGSLAQRIGVVVRLDESPTGGVAAKVVMPEHVLDQAPALPAPHAAKQDASPAGPSPANEESTEAPAAPVPATAVAEATPVTTNGLRKRVRSAPAPAVNGTAHDADQQSEIEAEPRPEAKPEPKVKARTASPLTPPPTSDPSPAPSERPVPAPTAAAPSVPVAAALAPSAWAPTPVAPERPAESAAPAEQAAPATTTHGLQKRVPGSGLATAKAGPRIQRGGATGSADAPSDSAAADDMFSLLNSFESGAARGRSDFQDMLAKPNDDDPLAPTEQPQEES